MSYADYIGIPFKYGGRNTEALDCFGLVMLLYKNLKNIDLPDVESPIYLKAIADEFEAHKLDWTPCEQEEGAVILFSIKGYGAHVGYVIAPDKMIHTWEKSGGVVIERISTDWGKRILGCYKYEK